MSTNPQGLLGSAFKAYRQRTVLMEVSQNKGTILGVPIMTIEFWGLYWGTLVALAWVNYHTDLKARHNSLHLIDRTTWCGLMELLNN